ncbi:MAG: histidine phosphatase family protein [Spirochaetales bacterium]|nr:histidine phosphatase family protein [Spirochaetales bacterium]
MHLEKNSKVQLLFIRHAERHIITRLEKHREVSLTKKGEHDSFLFGKKIKEYNKKAVIFHSPVKRCIQTAEHIFKGINDKNSTLRGVQSVLGGDHYSKNPKEISSYFNKYGNRKFLRRWFNSGLPDGFIMPHKDVARMEMNLILEQLDTYEGLIINITHDWNILVLLEYYFGLPFEEAGMPNYLDGIAVYKENDDLSFIYKKYRCRINKNSLAG